MGKAKKQIPDKVKFSGEFENALRKAINEALNHIWKEVRDELRRDIWARFDGTKEAQFTVIDGVTGQVWWKSDLGGLVTDYLEYRDDAAELDHAIWCENVAADLEKQAIRLRNHAAGLRKLFSENPN